MAIVPYPLLSGRKGPEVSMQSILETGKRRAAIVAAMLSLLVLGGCHYAHSSANYYGGSPGHGYGGHGYGGHGYRGYGFRGHKGRHHHRSHLRHRHHRHHRW